MTNKTKNRKAVRFAAEEVATRYDHIEKIDFLIEVKDLIGNGNNCIKTAIKVWNEKYS